MQNMTNFQRHFGSYANLPLNPSQIHFPDRSDEEGLYDEKGESTENNTDIEREEMNFVTQ